MKQKKPERPRVPNEEIVAMAMLDMAHGVPMVQARKNIQVRLRRGGDALSASKSHEAAMRIMTVALHVASDFGSAYAAALDWLAADQENAERVP